MPATSPTIPSATKIAVLPRRSPRSRRSSAASRLERATIQRNGLWRSWRFMSVQRRQIAQARAEEGGVVELAGRHQRQVEHRREIEIDLGDDQRVGVRDGYDAGQGRRAAGN